MLIYMVKLCKTCLHAMRELKGSPRIRGLSEEYIYCIVKHHYITRIVKSCKLYVNKTLNSFPMYET